MKTTKSSLRPAAGSAGLIVDNTESDHSFDFFMHLPIDILFPLLAAASRRGFTFHFGWSLQPVLALLAGVLILIRPKLLNFIVAVYLIVIGLIGLFHFR